MVPAKKFRSSVVVSALVAAVSAPAQIIPGPAQMHAFHATVDFEDLAIGAVASPFAIGELTFAAGPGLGIASVAHYGANGGLVTGKTLIPLAGGAILGSCVYSPITIQLRSPVQEFGLSWFDPNFAGNELRCFDAQGTLLAAVPVATHPSGGCCASFAGWRSATANIARVVVANAGACDVYAIDNIRWFPCANTGTAYGTGCSATSAPPELTTSGCTAPGTTLRLRVAYATPPLAPVTLLGFGAATVPLPGGCSLLLANPLAAAIDMQNAGFAATASIRLPVGMVVPFACTMQSFLLETGSPLGYAASQGLQLTIQ